MAFNPAILTWARTSAGLSIEEAAQTLGFRDTQERSAAERLAALEAGIEEPSRSVLGRMSKAYHRPLLVFYLSEPPRAGDRGQDFRRVPGADPEQYDPRLDALIRDIRGRQSIVRDLREQDDKGRVEYVGSATMAIPFRELASRIADRIAFSLGEFRRQPTTEQAFAYLRECVEASGAFILLLGNLGSYHTNISGKVFRGYAIADPEAPFVVVNDQDAKVAWSFTVLHETAHLWLGATGVSGEGIDTQVESYCNSVAGEILLPDDELEELAFLRRRSVPASMEPIADFARTRKISRAMVAYKLSRAGVISASAWRDLSRRYEQEWVAAQERRQTEERREGGPSFYVVKRHRLGNALLETMRTSLAEGMITPTKAGQVLGVNPRNVDPLLSAAGLRTAR